MARKEPDVAMDEAREERIKAHMQRMKRRGYHDSAPFIMEIAGQQVQFISEEQTLGWFAWRWRVVGEKTWHRGYCERAEAVMAAKHTLKARQSA